MKLRGLNRIGASISQFWGRVWIRIHISGSRAAKSFKEAKPGIFCILIIAAIISIALIANWTGLLASPSNALRLAGTALQLLGIVAVVIDLNESAMALGAPPVWEGLLNWLRGVRDIFRGPKPVSYTMTVPLGGVELKGYPPSLHVESNGSVEDRLKNLEVRMKRQETETSRIEQLVLEKVDEINARFQIEREARRTDEDRLLERVRRAVIGTVHVKLANVVYVVVGTLLSGWSG